MSKQTSGKRGKQSTAQKQAEARYDFEAIPAARPKAGAFGRRAGEPQPPSSKQVAASRVKTRPGAGAGRTKGRGAKSTGRPARRK
jgi:hypothetical protein